VTAIRLAITAFVLLLICLSAMGWVWTGAHQPAGQMLARRAVLVLGALAGIVGLIAIWRRPHRT
jgi:hypothetical protein